MLLQNQGNIATVDDMMFKFFGVGLDYNKNQNNISKIKIIRRVR